MGSFVSRSADQLQRSSDWSQWSVTVAGLGVAGYSCADALMQLGARVTVIDSGSGQRQQKRAAERERKKAEAGGGSGDAAADATDEGTEVADPMMAAMGFDFGSFGSSKQKR